LLQQFAFRLANPLVPCCSQNIVNRWSALHHSQYVALRRPTKNNELIQRLIPHKYRNTQFANPNLPTMMLKSTMEEHRLTRGHFKTLFQIQKCFEIWGVCQQRWTGFEMRSNNEFPMIRCNMNRRIWIAIGLFFLGLFANQGLADQPNRISKERPNILFAISDDQTWEHASVYGCRSINTPNFDRVAKNGVLFNNAFTASPGCTPSRSAILTGLYPWQLQQAGTHASQFPKQFAAYPDVLELGGYVVGYTGKGWGPGNFAVSGRTRNPAGIAFNKIKSKNVPAKGIAKTDYAANFEAFLKARPAGKPFCFWYGAHEPHRSFEKGSGLKSGKKLADVSVPTFLPDSDEIRSDILDYCLEIEWFDSHLGKMMKLLSDAGELDNTMIVVTSDNGMSFPRAKANVYEFGIHMPLAIQWPKEIPGGRVVDDLISHTDFAPTFLEAAEVDHPSTRGAAPEMIGESLIPLLLSTEQGTTSYARKEVYSCRERHSSSRWNNLTYPQRCVRTSKHLLIHNFMPERWPAGAPQKFEKNGELGPEHGGYHDIDACPSLTYLVKNRTDSETERFFNWAIGHRPEFELFDVENDPGCLQNLADDSSHAAVRSEMG